MTSTDAPAAAYGRGMSSVGANASPPSNNNAAGATASTAATTTSAMETNTAPNAPAQLHHVSSMASIASMPSPPTVSPLSTPAVTAAHSTNGDNWNAADDDPPKLSDQAQALPATSTAGQFAQGASGSAALGAAMDLGNPQSLAQLSQNLQQVQKQHQAGAAIATVDDNEGFSAAHPSTSMGMMPRHTSLGNVRPDDILMKLAQASSAQLPDQWPTSSAQMPMDLWPHAIAPSEISLQASFTQESDAFTGSGGPGSASVSASHKLESIAKIEFNDSVFHMTTYAVIIGRDLKAMEQARKDERREELHRRRVEESAAQGVPPPTPLHRSGGKFSKSYVSEEGGMLGPESDGEGSTRSARRRRPPSSAGDRSHNGDNGNEENQARSNRQYVSHTEGAAAVDLSTLHMSRLKPPPFVGIHSPGPNIADKTKKISRQHLRIEFNEQRGVFEAFSLHKNGFFREEQYCGLEQNPVTLYSGDHLQIKDVEFTFIINGVESGKTGAEEEFLEEESRKSLSIGGKEMSFDFEHSDHRKFNDTSDELSDVENVPAPPEASDDDDDDDDDEDDDADDDGNPVEGGGNDKGQDAHEEVSNEPAEYRAHVKQEFHDGDVVMQSAEGGEELLSEEFLMSQMPKRRGPGRPPKDGIMSKRERRELKKKLQETSKKTLPQEPLGEKIKRPVGRPRKNPLPEDGDKPEKRKYTKRKREDGDEGSDAEKRPKDKKDKKSRPKSPPLDLKREDFTEEELQKPSKNYGVLIDEALTAAGPDGLTLKQIYKRITAKYPWFFFHAETKGWESSVRHNLIGNEAFKKDDQTSLWSRVPGVELDAGKKRKATTPERSMGPPNLPPHHMQQQYFHGGNYMQQGGLNFTHGLPGPTYQANGQPHSNYQAHAAHPSQQYTVPTSQSSGRHPYPAQTAPPIPPQVAVGVGSGLMSRQPAASQQSTYRSPYERVPPPVNAPIKSEPSGHIPQTLPSAPVSQTNPQQASHSHPPRAPSNPAASDRPALTPEMYKSIGVFRTNMLNVMSKQTDKAGQIIETAINRALGLPADPTLQGFENVEKVIMNGVQGILNPQQKKQRNTTSASPAPTAAVAKQSTPVPSQSPAPTATGDAEIQKRVKAFRDTMVTNLKKKTDKAEAIVDAAINRAQGLPNTGPVPGFEHVDKLIFESATKTIIEVRKAFTRPASTTPAPAGATQTVQLTNQGPPRQTPSASPAPGQSSTPSQAPSSYTAAQINTIPLLVAPSSTPIQSSPSATTAPASTSKPLMPSVPRPGLMRPPALNVSRPGASVVRPPSFLTRKENDSAPSPPALSGSACNPASMSVHAQKTASPAPMPAPPPTTQPSAGAIEQITGQKRALEPVEGNANVTQPSPGAIEQITGQKRTSENAFNPSHGGVPSAGAIEQITGHKRISESVDKLSQTNTGTTTGRMTGQKQISESVDSPSQTSTGTTGQIAGQKRDFESADGSSNGGVDQPEVKKVALSSV